MTTTRSKITAGAATLVTGAGLALVLLGGNAGATAPQPSTGSTPANVVVTNSVPCGATALAIDPADRPTATVMASAPAAEQATSGSDAGAVTSSGVCSDTAPFQPGVAATAAASVTPAGAVTGR